MAKYDFGGGCPCGLHKTCECGQYDPDGHRPLPAQPPQIPPGEWTTDEDGHWIPRVQITVEPSVAVSPEPSRPALDLGVILREENGEPVLLDETTAISAQMVVNALLDVLDGVDDRHISHWTGLPSERCVEIAKLRSLLRPYWRF